MIKNLSSAVISDVLISMGYENQLLSQKFKPNFESAKIFGVVRTSALKRLEPSDDPSDIHKILHFIEEMNPGEILLVANGFEDMAFFGELMSTVSKRQGVIGAVIDGVTRDRQETRIMEFPVFAKGTYPFDLGNKATTKSIDEMVLVDGVKITSGDYLFGDSDAIVIIPKNIYEECISKSKELLKKEEKIKELIEKGISVKEISKSWGDF